MTNTGTVHPLFFRIPAGDLRPTDVVVFGDGLVRVIGIDVTDADIDAQTVTLVTRDSDGLDYIDTVPAGRLFETHIGGAQ